MKQIFNDLYYIGVNDRTKPLFESLWPLPHGVSYNSYLLVGQKTALIDTVDNHFAGEFTHKIKEVLGDRPLDYLVINHMEPDHSGSIAIIRKLYPNMQIVGNARTMDMLKGYYAIDSNTLVMKDGDELSLGNYHLRFYLTPMVHWPETMMTLETTTKTLFSGDAFGCFGALDGGAVDKHINTDRYWDEMIRYYSNIIGKYGGPVQKALQKLADAPVKAICSTHGPVWTEEENIKKVINTYDRLSRYDADNGVVIVYASMYGHTEVLAEMIASALSDCGIKNIVMHNASVSDPSYILRDIFKYKGLIVGSPTYNAQIFPKVDAILSQIESRNISNRLFACFGSFTWAGAAAKRIKAFAESAGFELLAEPIEMKQAGWETVAEDVKQLAHAMSERLHD